MSWYSELDGRQKKAFWACFGGWALDAMDVQMYALVMPTLMALWGLSKTEAGTLGTVALLASSVGGAIAGNLADRIGRVRVLQISILWFSIFTFVSGLAQTYEQMLAARTLQGIGFGGEWAAGAVLMAELLSPKRRGRIIAAVSSGWSVGYGIAAILFTIIFALFPKELAWRAMFFIGIVPALLILFVRRHVPEPDLYLVEQRMASDTPRLTEIFGRGMIGRTSIASAICLGVLGGNYTVLTWLPTFLQNERGLSYTSTGMFLLVNIAGSFLGYNVGGSVSDALGRRGALRLFALLGTMTVGAFVLFGSNHLAILVLSFPLGFAQSGMNAGIAPLLSELYPTRLRATGQGFCYNAGRGVGALFPTLVGILAASLSLTIAICAAAAAAYALVGACSLFIVETKDRRLTNVEDV